AAAATAALTASPPSSHGSRLGGETCQKVPAINARLPSTVSGTDHVPAGPSPWAGGGARRWSCQAYVRPCPTVVQPVPALAIRSALAVGEPWFTLTTPSAKRIIGSPR